MLKKVQKKEETKIVKNKVDPKAIQKSYLDKIESRLVNKGVVCFDTSNSLNINADYLTLPSNITEIPSQELGETLNAFTQQKVYLRTLLGRVELCVEDYKRQYYEVSAPIYKSYTMDKVSETAKERIISTHEAVKEVYYKYSDYKKEQDILNYSIENIEDIIFMLSREVTRRNGDSFDENRSYNVSKR